MNSSEQNQISPAPIMQLSTAYWGSQTLLTANRIGVFKTLAEGGKTVEDISRNIKTHERPTRLVLKACVALGLLEEENGLFKNSPMSQTYLVPSSKAYLGNAIQYSDNLYDTWGNLEKACRDNKPPMEPEVYLGKNEEQTRHFVYGMHNRALGIGTAMLSLVDLTGRKNMLDVGGGPGTYSALFTLRYPELHSTVVDLPDIVKIASEIVSNMGADRVETVAGDYMTSDFPSGKDVVLISGVFHRETEDTCRGFIRRAADSLDSKGMFIVSDVFADKDGNSPEFATLFGINMMLTAVDGGVHADASVASWMADAGFENISIHHFPSPMPHRLLVGYKP